MSGFSLVELVAVILLVSIMAVYATPRLTGKRVFDTTGFFESTVVALRYAQRAAIAGRRTTCVTFTATSLTLNIASVAGSSICDIPLAGPLGETAPYKITADYSPVPLNFSYNSLGEPSQGQSIFVSGISRAITIEQGSGYVH
jgi:MSHA pilin protein MshC